MLLLGLGNFHYYILCFLLSYWFPLFGAVNHKNKGLVEPKMLDMD
jgi:hypothetical protein